MRTVLSQRVEDGVGDVGTAGHAQGLEAVTTAADGDETLICDLLLRGGGDGGGGGMVEEEEGQEVEEGLVVKVAEGSRDQSHSCSEHSNLIPSSSPSL